MMRYFCDNWDEFPLGILQTCNFHSHPTFMLAPKESVYAVYRPPYCFLIDLHIHGTILYNFRIAVILNLTSLVRE